ncbi:SMI1/KNR4 family protein [Gimesia panareensis]|uniref:SMI1 / KNR4 family protein n=1 Tax=Gimesia panareensis TaxID=2527978 RepID=A0A518AEL1_9PLAN|nr:SMI1/KNR4 family protein [Gimesia panareensis]QDT30077.1 SMI1 / KNR4 family protein [Gimesia panareensis]QDU53165.1 SMI1 / KNR4 family protein [Gimesia panareensis]
MALGELLKIVTPPDKPKEVPTKPNWAAVEKKLGLQLPDDYKRYVTKFGTGVLGSFLRVYNPFSKREYTSLQKSVVSVCEIHQMRSDTFPYEFYPESPGLLPWGNDDNGNNLFWLTRGARNKWPIVVCSGRDDRSQLFEMGMTAFLARTFTGEVKCKIWPKPFAVKSRRFQFQPN